MSPLAHLPTPARCRSCSLAPSRPANCPRYTTRSPGLRPMVSTPLRCARRSQARAYRSPRALPLSSSPKVRSLSTEDRQRRRESSLLWTVVPPTSMVEAAKRLAAWTAVDRHIHPEHKVRPSIWLSSDRSSPCGKVIGIGSGEGEVDRDLTSPFTSRVLRFYRPIRCGAHSSPGRGTEQGPSVHPNR